MNCVTCRAECSRAGNAGAKTGCQNYTPKEYSPLSAHTDKVEVRILVRNAHGRRIRYDFGTEAEAYSFALSVANGNGPQIADECEILAVFMDGACIYSALNNIELDWEDMVGFLA